MTVLMECLRCKTTVINPKTINYMYEKCNLCVLIQKDMEEKAIDTFLHAEAERKLDSNA
jgi:hypothetical protein